MIDCYATNICGYSGYILDIIKSLVSFDVVGEFISERRFQDEEGHRASKKQRTYASARASLPEFVLGPRSSRRRKKVFNERRFFDLNIINGSFQSHPASAFLC